jgi:hypothetical protein
LCYPLIHICDNLKEKILSTQRDNRKFLHLSVAQAVLVKLVLAVVLGLALLGVMANTNTQQAHANTQSYSAAQVAGIINQVFGPYAPGALRVAQCESGLNPYAINSMYIGNSRASGVFQILYPSTWYGTSQAGASPYDAYANVRAAHDIFVRDGYSWREWVCQP